MGKKAIALITCAAFLFFEYACTHIVQQPVTQISGAKNQGTKIIKVLEKSGEVVEFGESRPGVVNGDSVVRTSGRAPQRKLDILKSDVESSMVNQEGGIKKYTSVKTKSGNIFRIGDELGTMSVQEETDRFIVMIQDPETRILLSNISLVWAKRTDPLATFLLVLVAIPAVLMGIAFINFQVLGIDEP
jgi:hypothetical protein